MLKCRVRPPGDQEACYDEAGERIFTVRAPRGVSRGDIINALMALGYNEKEALGAVKLLPDGVGVSDGIRQALKGLSKA